MLTITPQRTSCQARAYLAALGLEWFRDRYPFVDPVQACLYLAECACMALLTAGVRAQIQAGSCSWPRLRPDQDDGIQPTHLTYQWEANSPETKRRTAQGLMPEMHVWAAVADRGEIIDLSTAWMPDQCQRVLGRDWPGDRPPPFFWATCEEMPKGVIYRPDLDAIKLAYEMLERIRRR